MDEQIKQISSVKTPYTALKNIDNILASAYQAPREYSYSDNKNEKTIQKAVFYHRIRENASLSTGRKTAENDALYEKLASEVSEGRDMLVNFIRTRNPVEQAGLLERLMVSDKDMPWFERVILRSEEKKAESETAADIPEKATVQEKANAHIISDRSRLQSELLRSLAENMEKSTLGFFRAPGNAVKVRRLLATELHRRQIENEQEELKKVFSYESPEKQKELINNRNAFFFEKNAAEKYEEHIKALESTPEVMTALRRMARAKNLEELGQELNNPPSPQVLHIHENLQLMEQKLIPDAVNAFTSGPDAPEEGSELRKKLKELTDEGKNDFPAIPTPEACAQRVISYRELIRTFDKSELAKTAGWKKLKKELNDQIDRLEDRVYAPDRQKVEFNYRADTLIDYYDLSDPAHRPMNAMQAREKLIRGAELEQKTFADGDFVGTSQKISYDRETGLINKGPEKLITRVMNLSEKAGKKPELQLEELRKIKEVLKKTDPFYIKNSENYNNVLASLNKVIKAQETLDKDANVRQVAELRALYAELDSNAAKYVKDKSDRLKTGDDRAQIRVDAIKTLQSLTVEKHVGKVALGLYDEQKKLDTQQQMAAPCNRIMDKWKKAGTPSTPEGLAQFKEDFEALSSRFDMLARNFESLPYFKMTIAEKLTDFTRQASEVQQRLGPGDKISQDKLQGMRNLAIDSDDALKQLYAMDGTIVGKTKEKTEEQPKAELSK